MIACDATLAACPRWERGERHFLPNHCLAGHFDEYGFLILAQRCSFLRVIEEWRERMPIVGGWIRPFIPPMGYAAPSHACVGSPM